MKNRSAVSSGFNVICRERCTRRSNKTNATDELIGRSHCQLSFFPLFNKYSFWSM